MRQLLTEGAVVVFQSIQSVQHARTASARGVKQRNVWQHGCQIRPETTSK